MSEELQGERGNRRLQATIAGLRLCNEAQNELILTFEEYQRKVLGVGEETDSEPGGYRGSYGAELGYLHARREAIDSLIAAVERYSVLSESLSNEPSEMVER
jgi:hypothetical protein